MQQYDTCQKFLADRLVIGTCPTPACNYDSARVDQCEKCGKLLNATELITPRCKVCANSPHIRNTNHLFLELPLLEGELREYISSMSVAGSWSQNAIQATNVQLKDGLRQRCITRDLKWGVPVPRERFDDKEIRVVWKATSAQNRMGELQVLLEQLKAENDTKTTQMDQGKMQMETHNPKKNVQSQFRVRMTLD